MLFLFFQSCNMLHGHYLACMVIAVRSCVLVYDLHDAPAQKNMWVAICRCRSQRISSGIAILTPALAIVNSAYVCADVHAICLHLPFSRQMTRSSFYSLIPLPSVSCMKN
mmetsp:Transcript_5235/g.8610  ORF Transcript_5235/g.8610 Transcript_5235/m.8610 type:complete len:110 (-) Transcript_5235:424-753(-)